MKSKFLFAILSCLLFSNFIYSMDRIYGYFQARHKSDSSQKVSAKPKEHVRKSYLGEDKWDEDFEGDSDTIFSRREDIPFRRVTSLVSKLEFDGTEKTSKVEKGLLDISFYQRNKIKNDVLKCLKYHFFNKGYRPLNNKELIRYNVFKYLENSILVSWYKALSATGFKVLKEEYMDEGDFDVEDVLSDLNGDFDDIMVRLEKFFGKSGKSVVIEIAQDALDEFNKKYNVNQGYFHLKKTFENIYGKNKDK